GTWSVFGSCSPRSIAVALATVFPQALAAPRHPLPRDGPVPDGRSTRADCLHRQNTRTRAGELARIACCVRGRAAQNLRNQGKSAQVERVALPPFLGRPWDGMPCKATFLWPAGHGPLACAAGGIRPYAFGQLSEPRRWSSELIHRIPRSRAHKTHPRTESAPLHRNSINNPCELRCQHASNRCVA